MPLDLLFDSDWCLQIAGYLKMYSLHFQIDFEASESIACHKHLLLIQTMDLVPMRNPSGKFSLYDTYMPCSCTRQQPQLYAHCLCSMCLNAGLFHASTQAHKPFGTEIGVLKIKPYYLRLGAVYTAVVEAWHAVLAHAELQQDVRIRGHPGTSHPIICTLFQTTL